MRAFSLHPLAAAIICAILVTGGLGLFLFMPVICINWGWNSLVATYLPLPAIAIWQACLLYAAFITSAFLLGFINIEIKTEIDD